ncbi:MAG: hypothetical protein ACOCXQ_01125 [Patescibacteria group bacterium]
MRKIFLSRLDRLLQNDARKRVLIWGIWAVFLRLLIMPFFGHTDIINTYRRAARVAFEGFPLYLLNEQLVHAIEAGWLWFLSLFYGQNLFAHLGEAILTQPHINMLMFLFKVPYLLAEIAMWYLLFRYLIPVRGRNLMFVLFNPIMIFAVYVFGRYESMICLAIVGLLVLIKQRVNLPWLMLMTVVLVLLRPSMLLLVPALLLIQRSWAARMLLVATPVVSYIILMQLNKMGGGNLGQWVSSGRHTGFFFESQIDLGGGLAIYWFFALLTYFGLRMIRYLSTRGVLNKLPAFNERLKHENRPSSVALIALGSFTILGTYYATSVFQAQYVAWMLPFLYLLSAWFQRDQLVRLLLLLIHVSYFGAILSHLTFGEPTNLILLFPIAETFAQIPLAEAVFFYDHMRLANIARSVFTVSLLYLIMYLFDRYEKYEHIERLEQDDRHVKDNSQKQLFAYVWSLMSRNKHNAKTTFIIAAVFVGVVAITSVLWSVLLTSNTRVERVYHLFERQTETYLLTSDRPVRQVFLSPAQVFDRVQLRFGTHGLRIDDTITVRIKHQDTQDWWYIQRFEADEIEDHELVEVQFPPFINARGEPFIVELVSARGEPVRQILDEGALYYHQEPGALAVFASPVHSVQGSSLSIGNTKVAGQALRLYLVGDSTVSGTVQDIQQDLGQRLLEQRAFFLIYAGGLVLLILANYGLHRRISMLQ